MYLKLLKYYHSYQVQNIKNNNKLTRNYVYSQLLPIKKEFIESKLKVKEILEKKKVKRKVGYIEKHRTRFRVRREVASKKRHLERLKHAKKLKIF